MFYFRDREDTESLPTTNQQAFHPPLLDLRTGFPFRSTVPSWVYSYIASSGAMRFFLLTLFPQLWELCFATKVSKPNLYSTFTDRIVGHTVRLANGILTTSRGPSPPKKKYSQLASCKIEIKSLNYNLSFKWRTGPYMFLFLLINQWVIYAMHR